MEGRFSAVAALMLVCCHGLPTETSKSAALEARQQARGCGPADVGSGMSILAQNDLYGKNSSRTNAALVLSTSMTNSDAQAACSYLGESLWSPSSDAHEFLGYLAYQGQVGPFWTAGHEDSSCSTITATGQQGMSDCGQLWPVLCTQSAPISTSGHIDNSTAWRSTVASGDQSWTGFRDRFAFRFEGVRYAAQPERFTYSSLYNESGHSDALDFGSQCVQAGNVGSEDCLFLNIWTPFLPGDEATQRELKPVFFWIHGGAFTGGTGSDPTQDGGPLVSRGDVVVVTINYRLGTLGFLALEDGETNGNFGIADQITALQWVQEHIKAFGGDPSRVTIAGQSAGAASVRALLASPKAAGLFAGAIPQSNLAGLNYAHTYSDWYTIEQEVNMFVEPILNATNCTTASSHLACLRNANPYFLANQSDPDRARYLVVDGTYLVTDQLEVTGNGPINSAYVMTGFMRDDGAAFISYPEPNDTLSSFIKSNGFNLPRIGALSTYPTPSGPNATLDIFNTTARIATDSEFRCLAFASAYSATLHSTLCEIYFYEFNRSYQSIGYSPNYPVCEAPPSPGHPYGDPSKEYFKCHSGELYYTFGTIAFVGLPPRDEQDIPMAQFAVDTWASFVRTYNPTPDPAFLAVRGFTNTSEEVARGGGQWEPVQAGKAMQLRLMEYPSAEEPFYVYGGKDECEQLGFPIDFYERRT
ncbi:uncharacterized protein LTR77_007870 [Saxophila tyrrhenica]|uniref:Carboxylic ester hydrolase n=1 Tax=Saxophila tyrrhenica TaxID=1690608 RepID=A0AAV9P661_9PEZI|nr:hypothetical protein LTR77_007870 [Saxophila tyrrhenica]